MPEDRPNLAFGDLNPVEEPSIGRHLDPRNTRATDIIREAARDVFKKDALNNNGAFKGIVLRIETNPSEEEADSWISNIFGSERRPPLRQLKIRIPEIHAALPEPAKYGKAAGESHKIIDMYPTFIASTQDISERPVAAGDIVFCDFGNRENLTHPVYLGPVFAGPTPGAVGETSAQRGFEREAAGGLCASPPVGDTLFGSKGVGTQIPSIESCGNNPNQLNNNTRGNRDRDAENGHADNNDGGMPPMRQFEDKWRRGQNLGPIELVEIQPPYASKSGVYIAKEQEEAFLALREAAKRDGIRIVLNSGFRSYDQQKYLYEGFQDGRPGFNSAARPGWSNHQSGIAFDIANTGGGRSETYVWLSKNAHKFGFINSGRFFQNQRESWHWEYLGENNSRVVAEGKLSVRQKQNVFFA